VSSPYKIRGTRWESAVRDFLTANGLPVFRPALHGSADKGDLFGIAGWTIQCRDTAKIDLAGAMDDARTQAANAKTPAFVAIVKRRHKGVSQSYAVMPLEIWLANHGQTPVQSPSTPQEAR
jgi:hypothetical protein